MQIKMKGADGLDGQDGPDVCLSLLFLQFSYQGPRYTFSKTLKKIN